MALLHSLLKSRFSLAVNFLLLALLAQDLRAEVFKFASYFDFKNFLLLKIGEANSTISLATPLLQDSDIVNGLKLASFKGVKVYVYVEDSGRENKLWAKKLLQASGLTPHWIKPKALEGKTYLAVYQSTYSIIGHLGYFHGDGSRLFVVEGLTESMGFDSVRFWKTLHQTSSPEKFTPTPIPPEPKPAIPLTTESSVSHSLPKAVKWNSGGSTPIHRTLRTPVKSKTKPHSRHMLRKSH